MNHMDTHFFEQHSIEYLEMSFRTDRIEKMDHPDGYGTRTGDCGDTVEFFLMCNNNILTTVSFIVKGCMNTLACCNTVAEFTEGKSVDHAWEVTPEQVKDFLKTLPEDHFHCAELAVGGLYRALSDLKSKTDVQKQK